MKNKVNKLQIIGKKGSRARKAISDATGIKLYTGKIKPTTIINYGLAGERIRNFFAKYPSARNIPMINRYVGQQKHLVIKNVEKAGVLVPETLLSLPHKTRLSNWIEKKIHSSQGDGIRQAQQRQRIFGKYYQKMINNRKYELRVHAFLWIPTSDWSIDKRVGPANQIAWNFHKGGHFSRVKNKDSFGVFNEAVRIAKKVLEICNMAFGAVDFIVDSDYNIYFIEVNSSPGFEDLNKKVYFDAFLRLYSLNPLKYAR